MKTVRQQYGPSFDVTEDDAELIAKIVNRAEGETARGRLTRAERMNLTMDLTACHANGTPLQLKRLLEADAFNFAHDINGISRHIDRRTGQMLDCFCPRFVAPIAKAQRKAVI